MDALQEPSDTASDPLELLLAFLDSYRVAVKRKVEGLSDQQLRASPVPSGWTPLELVNHLTYMERRWLEWGFAARAVPEPWGDCERDTERWRVAGGRSTVDVLAALHAVGERTRELTAGVELTQRAGVGGRFAAGRRPPALSWILIHVLQEYARHLGHLDIARELIDGAVGE
jgi:hypothetical protein